MFVLHIDLTSQPALTRDLTATFLNTFRPAISTQPGYLDTQLMRSTADDTKYCLTIAFDGQESQQKWVATDLHQKVWPAIQNLCTDVAVQKFDTVSETADS
jgi:heme-degrading monooxygenase HmoA